MNSSSYDRKRRWHVPVAAIPLALMLVAAVLVIWPGLPVDSTSDAGGYQATADAAIAAITAALLVLVPTAVAVAIQALSPFSWRTIRILIRWRLAASACLAAVLGVGVPLVLAVNPNVFTTRLAFAFFLVSITIIG